MRTNLGGQIVAEFLPPKDRGSQKVMIFCTGMPGYPSREKYLTLCEHYARKNFWCFVPRYRGSWESEGEMFRNSPHLDILDVMDALPKGFKDCWGGNKYAVKNPEVYLLGSSFGGPAALLCSKDIRVKKVICFSPVLDWTTMDNTTEPIPKLSRFVIYAFGQGYRIAKNGWRKIIGGRFYNPAASLASIDGGKVLMFNASDDNIVSQEPVKRFAWATGCESVVFKKGGHLGIDILERRFYARCARHLRD